MYIRSALRAALCAFLISMALVLPCGGARAVAATGADDSARILQGVRALIGTWTCRGRAFARGSSPERQYRSTIRVSPDLGGSWLAFRVSLTAGGSGDGTVEAVDYWGIEPEHGTVTAVSLDSFGITSRARVDRLGSNAYVERGRTYGDPGERYFRTEYRIEADHSLTIRWSVSRDGRSWMRRTEDRCTCESGRPPGR